MDLVKLFVRIFVILAIPIFFGMLTFFYLRSMFFEPVNPTDSQVVMVEVQVGTTFRRLCKDLETQGLIKHWRVLDLLAKFKGSDTDIKAGEYELSRDMTPQDLLATLLSGDIFLHTVDIAAGSSIADIAKQLSDLGIINKKEFLETVADGRIISQAGIRANSFEGYLLPGTYMLSKVEPVKALVWKMLEKGEKAWPAEFSKRAEQLNLNRHEVLTLASLISEETSNLDNQRRISSVFHNRMNSLLKLESRASVVYGLKDFSGTLTDENLEEDHPYNTFVHYGLPPGPIANPGNNSVKAALYPVNSEFLFFAPDGLGGFVFAKNATEHQVNLRKLERGELPTATEEELTVDDLFEQPAPAAVEDPQIEEEILVPSQNNSGEGALLLE